jgi:hypothetical protein
MKTVTINTAAPLPAHDVMPPDATGHEVAAYLAAYLFRQTRGALHGRWDEPTRRGAWFYSTAATAAPESVPVDEVIFDEDQRWRFRSVVFRLGSMASEIPGNLGGVVRLLPQDPHVDPGPPRRYVVRASFFPEAGLWFRADIESDATTVAPTA